MGYLEDNGWEAVGLVQYGSKYEKALNEFLKSTAMCVQRDYGTVKDAKTAAVGLRAFINRMRTTAKRNGSEFRNVMVVRRGSVVTMVKMDE